MLDVIKNKIYNVKPHSEIAFDNISDTTITPLLPLSSCKALIS